MPSAQQSGTSHCSPITPCGLVTLYMRIFSLDTYVAPVTSNALASCLNICFAPQYVKPHHQHNTMPIPPSALGLGAPWQHSTMIMSLKPRTLPQRAFCPSVRRITPLSSCHDVFSLGAEGSEHLEMSEQSVMATLDRLGFVFRAHALHKPARDEVRCMGTGVDHVIEAVRPPSTRVHPAPSRITPSRTSSHYCIITASSCFFLPRCWGPEHFLVQ
jgi:hypothetical protein